jgi:hypothetical protein
MGLWHAYNLVIILVVIGMKNNKNKKVVRNLFWNHPLMGKGSVHVKSGKALRQSRKTDLRTRIKSGDL